MLKHQVTINVADATGKKANVLKGGDLTLRDRVLNLLFGKQQKMLVLIPSDSVLSVTIKEVKAGNE